jgi:hypothetical protein
MNLFGEKETRTKEENSFTNQSTHTGNAMM